MKKLIFVLILPLTLIIAQTNNEEKPIDLTGKFALMFQIDQNFDLNSFDGMSFAGKYFFSDALGVRLKFQTSYSEYDVSYSSANHENSTPNHESMTRNRDVVSYSFMPSIIYSAVNNNNLKFFIGGGPLVSYSNDERAEVTFEEMDEVGKANIWQKNYEIGLTFFANVEWFVTNSISLSAEYGFEYSYLETENWTGYFNDNELIDETSSKGDTKIFQSLPVSLGVSIYF